MNAYFAARVEVTPDGCWEWMLSRRKGGYGQTNALGVKRTSGAHRLSYEVHVGPIPDGMTVDHLCFNPPCVNPDHLRLLAPLQNSANQRRAYKTHCHRGHEFTPENTRTEKINGARDCKTCHRERERERRRKAVAANPGPGKARGERCHNAVLVAEDVLDIRMRRAAGESASALAREYGVSRPAIQSIVAGRTWAHLPSPDVTA